MRFCKPKLPSSCENVQLGILIMTAGAVQIQIFVVMQYTNCPYEDITFQSALTKTNVSAVQVHCVKRGQSEKNRDGKCKHWNQQISICIEANMPLHCVNRVKCI